MAAGASRPAALYRPEGSPLFAVCCRSRQNRRAGFLFCVDLPQSGYYNHNRSRTQNGRGRITAFTQGLALRGGGQQPVPLPLCGGGILQNPVKPCPMFRRGRCLRRPGIHAVPQGSAAGEIARPTLRPGAGGDIQPAAPTRPNGGPMKSSAPAQGAALHNRHPPYLPSRSRHPFALHCRAGVHARRKSLRWPGRVFAGPGAAPLSRLTPRYRLAVPASRCVC